MGRYGRSTGELVSPDIDLLVVPSGKETSFTLYEDDGISFDYEKGAYRETDISAVAKGESVTVRISKPRGTYKTPKRVFNLKIVHHGNTVLRKVQDDGEMHEITIQ